MSVRSARQMAQKNQEVTYIEGRQILSDFEQAVVLKVLDFNLQPKLIESAGKANEVARISFKLTKKKFMLGKADVLRMNEAIKARQISREKYLQNIYIYWKYYYELQKLTLYNLKDQTDLEEDFEKIMQTN